MNYFGQKSLNGDANASDIACKKDRRKCISIAIYIFKCPIVSVIVCKETFFYGKYISFLYKEDSASSVK